MAILSPQSIHQVLKESKLETADPKQLEKASKDLSFLLEKHDLTPDDILEQLRNNILVGETGAVRNKAIELALKLNGLLVGDSDSAQDLNLNITIIDGEFGQAPQGINPILLPRR